MKLERIDDSETETDEDVLFDLNEEPVERKRKRVEISLNVKGNANENEPGPSGEAKSSILRSRTMPKRGNGNKRVKISSSEGKSGNVGVLKRFKVDGSDSGPIRSGKRIVEGSDGGTVRSGKRIVEGSDSGPTRSGKRIAEGSDSGPIRSAKRIVEGSDSGPIRSGKRIAEGSELGPREQKKLLKEQIVEMLYKAGWTIEYKQRLSREYKDAIYVDREGRGYWSVTLAYKKLKERIDKGEGTEKDIAAFTPIPDDKLGLLFRVTTLGMKSRKNKNSGGKSNKKVKIEKSKVKSVDGGTKTRTRQTLTARRAGDGSDDDGYELYEGKRSLLSWMIDLGTVPIGGKVRYKRGRTKKMVFYGRIVKDGICCDCCNITHTVQGFEAHANSDLGKPYQNTYLESGDTLLHCLVDSWKKHVKSNSVGTVQVDVDGDDPYDDTCNICGDGGDLICCDNCPSTFHQDCLQTSVPSGDWHCVYCLCKFCGVTGESTSASDDSHNLLSELFTCRLCEEKFHVNCTKEKAAGVLHHEDEDPSFCGNECQKIFEKLHVLLGVKRDLDEGFSATVLQHREISGEASSLNDESFKVESNAKLAVAFTVMDECFEPIVDERSGTSLIHSVVYSRGSNVRRLNYGGFYTIILEKSDEVIAAASVRIHGRQLAEMPFIGTRFAYRRQGMCSRLLNAIEMVLSSLGVEKLVMPAVFELNDTWTKVFHFYPLEESKRKDMKHMSLVVFPKTSMLQKTVNGHRSIENESMSKTSSDAKNKRIKIHGESVTYSSETARHQNMQEKSNGDSGRLAEFADVASRVEMHYNDRVNIVNGVDSGDEKSDVKFSSLNLEVSSEKKNLLINLNDNDASTEVKVCDSDKVNGADLGVLEPDSKINTENLGASSETGNLVTILPMNTSPDCNLEPVQRVEESNDCINALSSLISNNRNSNVDISGVDAKEEGTIERQECCISKEQVIC